MASAPTAPLSPAFATTRDALHRLAVYVVSPAQRLATGNEIVLQATPGGFGTTLLRNGGIRVDGTALVDERGGRARRTSITSLRAMAAFVGIEPDVAQQELFDVPPHGDLDEPLRVDPDAAAELAAWYAYTTELLEGLRREAQPADDASPVRLWPEHFDAAVDLGDQGAGHRGTYGGSPGDRHHPQPYLYASPWAGRIDPFFDDPSFKGAALTYDRIIGGADGAAFLLEARSRIRSTEGG
ncbi:MAG TPA: hypothetical protein VGC71_16365 [Gaiellales bacterium]|jgi:hypothetical protein